MERDLSVNAGRSRDPHGLGGKLNDELNRVLSSGAASPEPASEEASFPEPLSEEGSPQEAPSKAALSVPVKDDQGPCLYLGDAGQRCGRRAVEGGFCRQHQGLRKRLNSAADAEGLGSVPGRSATPTRVLVASLGIIGILLPYILDLVREIFRWIHSQ